MYVSFLGINPRFAWSPHASGGSPEPGALYVNVFEQPAGRAFFFILPSVEPTSRPAAKPSGQMIGYARHSREPFGSGLKADGRMGCPAFAEIYGEAGSPLYVNPLNG